MYGVDIQPLFLQNMSLSTSSLGLVPLLEDLLLDAFPALQFNVFLLFSMLESRCGEGAVLQQISINGTAVTLPDQLLRHATLQENGFRLHFATQDFNERLCESLFVSECQSRRNILGRYHEDVETAIQI